jgi:prefoldin beta subunit
MVKNELNLLDPSDVVYKLVGPLLIKQEQEEAKLTVTKRLEFITKEM